MGYKPIRCPIDMYPLSANLTIYKYPIERNMIVYHQVYHELHKYLHFLKHQYLLQHEVVQRILLPSNVIS